MRKKSIYALYLPQYHAIPENDRWWGQGYTEWNAVRSAKPLFRKHSQPKVPLDNNYYDLSDETGAVWKWQAEMAQEYGVNGFCIYHYWFENGKKLLEKPMEILLKHREIPIEYFVCWANEPWKKTWYGNNQETLVEQEYGDESEWRKHFLYLQQFFLDDRYVKIDNKPVIAIYKTAGIEQLEDMRKIWNDMAKELGFSGVYILGAKTAFEQEDRVGIVDGEYLFEPAYTMHYQYKPCSNIIRKLNRIIRIMIHRCLKYDIVEQKEDMRLLYKSIKLPSKAVTRDIFWGICPGWDNTPRKQEKGCVFVNSSPELFRDKLYEMATSEIGGDIIMINAWNEWGEGAYLEPDEENRYAYLEAIKSVYSKEKK